MIYRTNDRADVESDEVRIAREARIRDVAKARLDALTDPLLLGFGAGVIAVAIISAAIVAYHYHHDRRPCGGEVVYSRGECAPGATVFPLGDSHYACVCPGK